MMNAVGNDITDRRLGMVAVKKTRRRTTAEAIPDAPVEPAAWVLSPIQTKEQQVAEILREKIFSGVFMRGQKLKQAEIAKMLETSITPVRAALKLLEAQGYVRVAAHRGAVVAPFQISEVNELYNLRLDLEPKLTLAAAKNANAADIRMLSSLNDDLRRAAQRECRELVRSSNFRFHFRLYELANMPQTLEFVRILWAKYPFDLLGSVPRVPEYAHSEHARIIEALERHDARVAMRAMQSHIELGHRAFKHAYLLAG